MVAWAQGIFTAALEVFGGGGVGEGEDDYPT